MAQRDREDKAALKALRKSKRDEQRAKRLAKEGGGPVAVLGNAGDYSGLEGEEDEMKLMDSDSDLMAGEVAHLGMAPVVAEGVRGRKTSKVNDMSLAEQEALALHLLRNGG